MDKLKKAFADDPEVLRALEHKELMAKNGTLIDKPHLEALKTLFKGDDGYTPVKGEDYFTEEELKEVKKEILRDATPIKFKDYFTESEIEQISSYIRQNLKREVTPIKGVDYFDGVDGRDAEIDENGLLRRFLEQIPKPKEVDIKPLKEELRKELEEIIPTKEDFLKYLKSLKGNDRLDISNIRNANQKFNMNDQRWHGGGLSSVVHDTTLTGDGTTESPLSAVAGSGDVTGPASSTDGNVVLFNGATGKVIKDSNLTLSGNNTGDQNLFETIAVSGQDDVVADSTTDTLTFIAGTGISIVTDSATDSITFAATVGGGDVVGPGSATDNAVTRFDGATGKVIQNSNVTLDDTGIIAGLQAIQLDTTPVTLTPTVGQLYWDSTEGVLAVNLDTTNSVTQQIGTETFVKIVNKTGVQINDGQVVYVNGAQGNRPTAALALADTIDTSRLLGVATQNIANNDEGFITVLGEVHGYNTSSFTDGDKLYLSSTTAGMLVNYPAPDPNNVVLVAVALNSTNNGSILVQPHQPLAADSTLADNSDIITPTQKAVKTYADTKEPAISASSSNTVWHGDKTFSAVVEADMSLSDVSTNNATTLRHGFLPKLSGNATQYLDGNGNYSTPTAGVANSYSATPFTNQTSINVVHNFGTYPAVQVSNDVGAVVIPLSIIHNTANDFTVAFSSSTTGTIVATVGSPQPQAVIVVTDDYTVLTTDRIVVETSAAKTLTLPTAVGNTGREFLLKNASSGNISVDTTSSQTIDGQLVQTLPSMSSMSVFSDGSNYYII